jgi:uncharacterized protein (TIGR02588 family)
MDQDADAARQDPSGQDREQDRESMEAPPSFWEWVVAALGLVLVLGSIAFLLVEAATASSVPPQPVVRVLDIRPRAGEAGFLVRLRVDNTSRATAASLRVAGELKQGDEVVERSETEFQYLPGRSSREAGLFFTRDPRALRLELSARSFQEP